MEHENQSDDETVEFDIEVVSSSSSVSFELQDDNNEEPVDFASDQRQEEEGDAAHQSPPPTHGNLTDECEQERRLHEVNQIECESDKKSQEEIEGAKFKQEPTAVEHIGAENDQPPPSEGCDFIDELEHSEHLSGFNQEHEHEQEKEEEEGEEDAESAVPSNGQETRATSRQQQSIEHVPLIAGAEHAEDNQLHGNDDDEIPLGDKSQDGDNCAEQYDTAGPSEQQTAAASDDVAATAATSTVVSVDDTFKQEDDLTNNQETAQAATACAELEVQLAEVDQEVPLPEGHSHYEQVVQPEMAAIECCLVSEVIKCPTGWSFGDACACSLESADSKVPNGILPALRVATPVDHSDNDYAKRSEERAAYVQEEKEEGAQCELNVDQAPEVVEVVGDSEQQPTDEEELSQHRMGDIFVRLDGVPDIDSDRAHSPASSPGLESENNSIASSLALGHPTTNHSSGHDTIYQQQMQQLHQQQVRRSSSAHLLASTFEDEDLEREFDEEPEFERRNVQVKRDQDPRDEYRMGDELGRGKFGTVVRCVEESSGRALAAKLIHMRRREDREDVEREVAIMSVLQHKRLLQLYDAFDDGRGEMCLITELVEGGELFERIVDDDFDLTEKKAAIFMRQICEGVEYMHGQQIVHLDMKPENILCLSRTGNRIKLIDFGLARRLDPKKPTRVMFGTPDFAAPEVLAYETVTLATDMWSVGVICYVLLSGLSPFMGDSDMETMANVMRATFDFNDSAFEAISDLAKDFISKLLVRDPTERLKPSECLKHAWLARGGAPLEAAIRSRRESSAVMISAHHRLALEQAAMLAAVAAAAAVASGDQHTDSPQTPPVTPSTGPFASRPSFGAESSASSGGMYSLDKRRLKRYVVRRKWHKTVHAIMALGRMGANLRL